MDRFAPAPVLAVVSRRVLYYWLPPVREHWPAQCNWILTALGAAGAWMGRRNRAALLLTGSAVICCCRTF